MKLQSLQYLHEATGITFKVIFEGDKKHIKISNNRGDGEFVFNSSKPETIIKVAEALLEIGEFCAKMVGTNGMGEDSYNLE